MHIDVGRRIMRSKFEAASRAGSSESTRALQKLIYVSDLVYGARKVRCPDTPPPCQAHGACEERGGVRRQPGSGIGACCLCCDGPTLIGSHKSGPRCLWGARKEFQIIASREACCFLLSSTMALLLHGGSPCGAGRRRALRS